MDHIEPPRNNEWAADLVKPPLAAPEPRALSRRKFAVRTFDAARRASAAIGAMAMEQAPAGLEELSRANHVAMYFGGILIAHACGTAALAASKIRELPACNDAHQRLPC